MKKLQMGPAKVKEEVKKEEAKVKEEAKKEEQKNNGSATDDLKPGRIEGPISGVDKKLVNCVMAVSAFYGNTLKVTSGLRSNRKQGEVMWDYWVSNLKHGMIYDLLIRNAAKRKELDDLYVARKREEVIKIVEPDARIYSRHVTGGALDIERNTDQKMVNALNLILRVYDEALCYHLDFRGRTPPGFPISDSIKSKWKR